MAEHVKGTPDRYKHGWVKVDGAGSVVSKLAKPDPRLRPNPDYDRYSISTNSGETLGEKHDVSIQMKAQRKASDFYDNAEDLSSDASGSDLRAAEFWQKYQAPNSYGEINGILRSGKDGDNWTYGELQQDVSNAFGKMGIKTASPMVVYRGLHGNTHDWASILKPGTVYTEKGMVSTTAQKRFAQGWLPLGAHGEEGANKATKRSAIVELRLPKGTNILGGDPQFIETMLRPGTQYKVVSSTVEKGTGVDPLGGEDVPVTYTHIVAEVIPNED